MNCPNCGAPVTPTDYGRRAECSYCKSNLADYLRGKTLVRVGDFYPMHDVSTRPPPAGSVGWNPELSIYEIKE